MDVLGPSDMKPTLAGPFQWTSNSVTFSHNTVIRNYYPATYVNQTASYYIDDAVVQLVAESKDLTTEQTFAVTPDLTCSKSGNLAITHSLTAFGGESIPVWLSIDATSGELSGTAPVIESNTTYSVYIRSSYAAFPAHRFKQFSFNVEAGLSASGSTPDSTPDSTSDTTSDSATTSAFIASALIGVASVAALVGSITSGSSPTSLWSLINQIQLLIHFILIDTVIPADIEYYIEGQSFTLGGFDFIPAATTPGISVPVKWTDSPQRFKGLEGVGLESRSSFTNLYSFFCTITLTF
jgi:hypothetical protein